MYSTVEKSLYKITIFFLRVIPMVMAGLYLLNTVLSYLDINVLVISYIAGVGFIPWLFILLSSYMFRFCSYHRMFLWYILVNNIICEIDYSYGLPIDNWNLFILHIIIAGTFLYLILYLKLKCNVKQKTG